MDPLPDAESIRHEVRRRPTQERSRQRFEDIVEAAASLIAERGIEPVTMTDIAERAEIVVTALYRYFPSRQAIVRELALRSFEADEKFLLDAAEIGRAAGESDVAHMIAEYCRHHAADSLRMQIRHAVHADAELSAIDLDGSRHNASLIAGELVTDDPSIDRSTLERRALVLIEIVDGVISLATRSSADEATRIIDGFAAAAARALLAPG